LGGADPDPMTDEQLIEAMVGRAVPPLPATRPAVRTTERAALSMEGVSLPGDELVGVNLDVHAGELVGVAGIAGNGQRQLFEVALGLRTPTRGSVRVAGQLLGLGTGAARRAMAAAAVGVPEDPIADAVVPGLDVAQHLAVGNLGAYRKGLGVD